MQIYQQKRSNPPTVAKGIMKEPQAQWREKVWKEFSTDLENNMILRIHDTWEMVIQKVSKTWTMLNHQST